MTTRRLRGMPDADQEIPDIGARRPGVHQICGGFEREPGVEFAERALHVAARELGALHATAVDNRAGIVGGTIGSVGAG